MEEQISFLQGIINNLPAIITGITAIFTAAATGFFTWLVSKNQFGIKKYEMKSQAQLKAREHLYNSYRQKLESRSKSLQSFYSNLGDFYGSAIASEENEKNEMIRQMVKYFKKIFEIIDNPIEYYKGELIREELMNEKYNEKLKEMNDILNTFKREITDHRELDEDYFRIIRFTSLIGDIESDLIESKSEKLFSVFLK